MYIEPDEETISHFLKKQQIKSERNELLEFMKGKKTISKDNKEMRLFSRILSPDDLDEAIENDAEGFCICSNSYYDKGKWGEITEELLYNFYQSFIQKVPGQKVIIWACELGILSDQNACENKVEDNPAMGYHSIRAYLDNSDLLKMQIRALLRSTVDAQIGILFPMIISIEEIRQIKVILEEVQNELQVEGIPYAPFEIGIGIETPAAVMISDLLAEEVDFFSICGDELTQYTLAADRVNPSLEHYYNPHHLAIFRMIRMVVENAAKAGIWCEFNGEIAENPIIVKPLMKFGVHQLCLMPSNILGMRQKIREWDIDMYILHPLL